MKIGIILLALLLTATTMFAQSSSKKDEELTKIGRELIKLNQELIDALARGDKSVADRIYADTFVRISVKGELLTKAELLKTLKAPEPGIKIVYESLDIQVFEYDDSAILTYLSIRHTDNKGEKSDFYYRVADTFVKRSGRWQKAISTGTPITEKNSTLK